MAQPKSSVFAREATGLVKNVSILDAISLNISNMSAGAALAVIGFTMVAMTFAGVSVSGVNLVIGSIIAFLFSIPQIVVYTTMTQKYPRTGGDYIWVSRTFGGLAGSSLSFMGYTLETLGYLALITLSAVFAIGSVGLFFNPTSSTMLGLALPGDLSGSAPAYQFVLGAVIFGILILINIFKPKFGYKLVSVLILIGIITIVIGIFTLLAGGQSGVISYMNSLGNANVTYAKISSSYTGPTFNFGATLFILPFFAIFVYPWLNAAPAVASEMKGRSALRWNVPLAAIIVFVLVTSAFAAMYYAGGYPFITAALSNPTLVFTYSFNFWTLAMGVSSNVALQWILGAGWILWNIAILAYGIIVFSRYLFAQSFDRFLPTKLSYVSSRFGSPVVAHVIDLVITVGLVGAIAFLYGSLQAFFAAVVASMIYFFFIGITSAVHGARKETGRTRGTLVVSGVLMAAVFAFIIYQFLANPTIWGTPVMAFGIPGYDFAYIYVVSSFIAGVVIYLASKAYHKSKGIDITLAYREIPPE
jgi:amino acid transporter